MGAIAQVIALSLEIINLSACATTKVVYKDVPEGYVPVKRKTLDKLVEELNMTRFQLLECWEKIVEESIKI